MDGFPKTLEQAKYLDHLLKKHSADHAVHVIYMDIPLNIALERVENRRECSMCGKIYNLKTRKPKMETCDRCGASLIQRICDQEKAFLQRVLLFNKTIKPLLKYYASKDILIKMDAHKSLKDFQKDVLDFDERA